MKYLLCKISMFCLGIILLFAGIASAQDLTIGNYSLVSKTRVSRTEYNYTYQADITNSGSDVQNVTATLTSNSSHTIVVAGTLSFGDVASGATVTSSDTFTIKQNRLYTLDWSDLAWDMQHESVVQPLRIKDITPDAALPGAIVTVTFSGNANSEPLQAVLGSQVLDTEPLAGRTDAVTFQVAAGAKSAPLYLRQGDRSSNAVMFYISDISLIRPAPEDTLLLNEESGMRVAVNLLSVIMKDEFDTLDEAQRVADLQSGSIVGCLPGARLYQVRLPTRTLEALDEAKEILEADPAVDYVMSKILGEGVQYDTDWPTEQSEDESLFLQRLSNRVREGAELYGEKVTSTESFLSKVHPIFTSIGVVENGVDYHAADFDGYGIRGTSRSNNIAIYARDVEGSTTHGSIVTAMIAAELFDADQETGKSAGLLHALGNSHGGFNISVSKKTFDREDVRAVTMSMLENGAIVINWSFGYRKEDYSAVGREEDFDTLRKFFEEFLNDIESKYPKAVIVAAAGNDDILIDPDSLIPQGIDSDCMIVVGAHEYDPGIMKAEKSNWGNRVDISAAGAVRQSNGETTSIAWTSYAAPLVTATIAAMKSINPDLTPKEIRNLLRKSALPIVNEVKDSSGAVVGVFTAPISPEEVGFYDPRLGVGSGARLKVEDAIQAAIDSLEGKTVPKGEPVEVELKFGEENVTKSVEVTVPSGDVFDKVDILFLVDVSGSYGDDITQFKNKAVDLVDVFHGAGKNVQICVATFSDFPIPPYGYTYAGDYAYQLNQPLTTDPDTVITAIDGITLHYGGDGPESQLEALYQAATGAGRTVADHPYADIASSSVGWRSGSFPIIFLATDAGFHNSDSETGYPGAGRTQTLSELASRGIRVYGLQSGGSISDVVSIVADTGGESFTLSRNSSEIVEAVIAALEGASSSVDIRLVPNGDFAELIQSITPEDGYQDVTPGETRTFDVTFSRHLWSEDPTADHIFSLRLEVVAEGVAVIMEIPVTIHVKFR